MKSKRVCPVCVTCGGATKLLHHAPDRMYYICDDGHRTVQFDDGSTRKSNIGYKPPPCPTCNGRLYAVYHQYVRGERTRYLQCKDGHKFTECKDILTPSEHRKDYKRKQDLMPKEDEITYEFTILNCMPWSRNSTKSAEHAWSTLKTLKSRIVPSLIHEERG